MGNVRLHSGRSAPAPCRLPRPRASVSPPCGAVTRKRPSFARAIRFLRSLSPFGGFEPALRGLACPGSNPESLVVLRCGGKRRLPLPCHWRTLSVTTSPPEIAAPRREAETLTSWQTLPVTRVAPAEVWRTLSVMTLTSRTLPITTRPPWRTSPITTSPPSVRRPRHGSPLVARLAHLAHHASEDRHQLRSPFWRTSPITTSPPSLPVEIDATRGRARLAHLAHHDVRLRAMPEVRRTLSVTGVPLPSRRRLRAVDRQDRIGRRGTTGAPRPSRRPPPSSLDRSAQARYGVWRTSPITSSVEWIWRTSCITTSPPEPCPDSRRANHAGAPRPSRRRLREA